ncbi:MAG: TonB-dependent receptor [Taibaiella sp.]|nr:TonB-dependent receptor [Taibaiella sp.]
MDVGFTDAISGYKQISLLGLSGPNVAFTRENIPDTRGLANIIGLTFTPGPWVESIQLSKGTGSVVNGYEGVAGQINVELHKPKEKNGIKLLLNAYQSTQGRTEANMVYNQILNSKWNTTLLAHVKSNWMNVDQNNDSFLDQPLGSTYLLGNRWMYYNPQGWEIQLGLKGVYMDLWGGESSYNRDQEVSTSSPWGFYNNTQRAEAWAKIGKIYTDKPYQSMGLQLNAFYHDQDARYGLNTYQGKQKSFYANYIFQSIIHSTEHTIKFGGSFQYDGFDEAFAGQNYARQEIVPGIFTEYAYHYLDKFSVVAGIRGDYNNIYGAFLTPRLHLRFAPEEKLVFRASIGRAQRTVNVFAEHIGFMASNRTFELPGNNHQLPFGLKPEVAWNMGVNMVKQFMLNYRDGSLSLDYYYTHFDNMVITDIEQYRIIRFYNLDGKSYAHSFQAQLDYEVMRKWDWRVAYRWYDVKATYEGKGLLQKPLLAAHRFFVNTAYETRNNWSFDLTANWTGAKRMPEHILNSGDPARSSYATPSFWIWNGQVSKSWEDERWKIYAGVENILGTMQHHLILGRQDPYAEGFDAGLVWGSAMGRNIYIGVNYQLK